MGPADSTQLSGPVLPLSLSQREVWRDQCAWPGSAHLNLGGGAYLVGVLDLQRFKRALAQLVAQNEALRLGPLADGTQKLLLDMEPFLLTVDMSDTDEPRLAMRAWWDDWIRQPFVLDGTPPWRFALLRANDTLHGLTIQFHHLVMDGWGTSLVMQRWSEIYNALGADAGPSPSPHPGYLAFVEESNAYSQSPAFKRDAEYWRAQLPTLPSALVPPRVGAARQHELATAQLVVTRIARSDYDSLGQRAAAIGLTPFNFFLAALALYFARVFGRDSVVIGVPSLNRSGRRYRETLGMFVGVMAVSLDVAPGMTVAELLAGVGAKMRGALRHPRYPLSEFGRALEVVRSGRDRLFDVLLSYERQDYAVSFGAAELVESRQLFSGVARYPLGVTVCEFHAGQDLELVLEGSAGYFADKETALLVKRVWHVVQALAATPPETRVDDVSILPADEQHELVHVRHAAIIEHATTQPFIAQFEHHAATRPQAISLVWDGGQMDYGTLNQRASQLAHRLVALGAIRDTVVAVAISRSPDLVVALLAIAKAGAAFLPLDPDAPVARLAGIVQESAAVALLVQEESWERLAHLHVRTVVTGWQQALADSPAQLPLPAPAAGDLAYVLFTSGSTGRPKGVEVEHATLSRRLAWLSRVYGVNTNDRSALATQATFDPSLIELCLPLVNGASIALAPPGRLRPAMVAEFAMRHAVTIMAFVPSTLAGFLDAAQNRADLKLRVACCGGEVLSPELARRYRLGTNARLFNVYGPTEACIFATAWECGDQVTAAALPIGTPIDDTRIYVLDAQLQPLPYGVAGEIFIGGNTLARGYLGRPELTREAFVDDPFCPGGRMYRSGDRGWLAPDGQLHFQGRLDRQIKLRGYRIELGEIEAALLAIEGVTQAAAKLVEHQGRPAIHAWVASTSGHGADSLQRVLRVRLPDYMVPSSIGVFATLATGSAGKIDYDGLPEIPEPGPRALARAPNGPLERDLLALWEEVLGRRPLTVHDNFFDAGGDSLAAVGVLVGTERLLARKVPLYFLTEHPTVERLVLALESGVRRPGLIVDFGPASASVTLYLAASGHGDLMRFQTLAHAMFGVCDVRMLQPPMDRPVKRITDLAALYADSIQMQGSAPVFVAGFSVGGIAALETARLLLKRGAQVRGLILIDTVFPKAVWGGTFYWRLFGWLVRNLRLQDLSINGRRLGAMVNDPGLVGQVMAMGGYRAAAFQGPVVLIKTSGLSRWDRALFGSWRKLMGRNLLERQIAGLHGSIFEARNVHELSALLAGIVRDTK